MLCSRVADNTNTQTTNKRNKLTFIAEPMDDGLAEDLEAGKVKLDWDKKKVGFLKQFADCFTPPLY